MKTKNLFIVLCICVMGFACTLKNNTFIIEGSAPEGYNNFTAYLIDPDTGNKIDSTKITNNKFSFTGAPDTTAYRVINIEDKLYSIVIPETGTIKVNMNDINLVGGTNLNDKLSEFQKEKRTIGEADMKMIESLRKEYEENEDGLQEAFESYRHASKSVQMNFLSSNFSENKSNAIAKMIFLDFYKDFTLEELVAKYHELSEDIRNSDPVQEIYKKANAKELTAEGKMFTDFTIVNGNNDGSSVSLSNYVGKGKYMLVDFWASWCGPCIRETPVIAEVYNKYKGDKFGVLGVAVWEKSRENTLNALEEHGITWPQILDAKSVPTEYYGISGIPHIILFGPDGTILARGLRGDSLKAKVAEVMEVE